MIKSLWLIDEHPCFLSVLSLYVLAPLANARWLATDTDPLHQFVWHTFVYGGILGVSLASRLPEAMSRVRSTR